MCQDVSCMTLMQPWLLAASNVCACGFQQTALINWEPSDACPLAVGPENTLFAMGFASAL